MNTLLSWLGKADIENMQKGQLAALAAIALKHEPAFDNIIILANSWHDKTLAYHSWLSDLLNKNDRSCGSLQVKNVELVSPIDYESIHVATESWITPLAEKSDSLCINISSGTPAMAVISVLLGKGKDNTSFYQSAPDNTIAEAVIPLDFGREYVKSAAKNAASKALKLPNTGKAFSAITAKSAVMKKTIAEAKNLAASDVPILITGETGTGKENMAKAIHQASLRADKPLRVINCGAIPETLVDSILFGHIKGAFTGANSDREGIFEQAHGGTLFLDEIGELSADVQVKLLRALQQGEINRVGDDKTISVDVRVIGATHRDLTKMMIDGVFREDLFYRLAVGIIQIPALRERADDIPILIDEFQQTINHTCSKQPNYKRKKLSESAIKFVESQPWPGNIRELWNTMNRVFITSGKSNIEAEDIQKAMIKRETHSDNAQINLAFGQQVELEQIIENTKKKYILAALKATGNHLTRTAEMLSLNNRQTLKNWMKSLKIE